MKAWGKKRSSERRYRTFRLFFAEPAQQKMTRGSRKEIENVLRLTSDVHSDDSELRRHAKNFDDTERKLEYRRCDLKAE